MIFSLFFFFSHGPFSFKACQRGDWWVRTRNSFVITNIFSDNCDFFVVVVVASIATARLSFSIHINLTMVSHICRPCQTSLQWALYTLVIKKSSWRAQTRALPCTTAPLNLPALRFLFLELKHPCNLLHDLNVICDYLWLFLGIIRVRSVTLREKEEKFGGILTLQPKTCR